MKFIAKKNTPFLLVYLAFLIIGAVILANYSKGALHISFNHYHSPFFDIVFSYLTYLGEGIMVVLAVIILLTVSYRSALIVSISNIIASLLTQLLKRAVFDDYVRPKKFFEGVYDLYFVPGVDNHLYYSFPSGHTTCAFSLYFALALLVNNKLYKFLLFIIALLVGYSRVYLSQHFFMDIYAGSIIGVGITYVVFYVINGIESNKLDNSLTSFFQT